MNPWQLRWQSGRVFLLFNQFPNPEKRVGNTTEYFLGCLEMCLRADAQEIRAKWKKSGHDQK